jgi:low affinity Fe/Cu permease
MPNGKPSTFTRLASWTAHMAGRPIVFAAAFAMILGWALLGPVFGFSDTWQLVINTTTTIVTFLMVFLIQNTQNRDGQAVQIKLDELIRAIEGAQNQLLDLEEMDEEELERIRGRYEKLAQEARGILERGKAGDEEPRAKGAVAEKPGAKSERGRRRTG